MRNTNWRFCLIAAAFGFCVPSAYSQTPSSLPEWIYSTGMQLRSYYLWPDIPKWEVNGGLSADFQNKYPGSGEFRFQGGPSIDIRYRDIAFAGTGEGIGVNIFRGKDFRVGTAITYDLGRPEDRSPKLTGLDDIGPAPEIKLFGEYVLFPLTFRFDARKAIGGYNGAIGDLSVYTPIAGSKTFFIFVGPSVTFADRNYTQAYFGVKPEQSAASGYPVFAASGGLQKASFGINATCFVYHQWYVNLTGGISRLFNDAVDSPISDKKVSSAVSFTVGYDWRRM